MFHNKKYNIYVGLFKLLERQRVRELVKEKDFSYSEHVKLGVLPEYKYLKNKATSEIVGEGILTITREKFTFEGTKENQPFKLEIDPKNLPTFGMCTDVTFFYTFDNGKYYEFIPEKETLLSFSPFSFFSNTSLIDKVLLFTSLFSKELSPITFS